MDLPNLPTSAYAQLPLLILIFWLFTVYLSRTFPTLQGKTIVLLTAHPDDEAMFFSPTLLHLTRPELQNRVFILCLSAGNADGLGPTRTKEVTRSAVMLGLAKEEHVVVVDDEERLPDSMSARWDAKVVAGYLTRYFAPRAAGARGDEAPPASIDVLITFDERGVSGHPNHGALLHGAQTFLRNLMSRHAGWECPVKLYSLISVPLWRKYTSVFDLVATIVGLVFAKKERGRDPTPLFVVSTPWGLRTGQRAMTEAHKSQMRWFRWGWIGLSRYMVINDLRKVKVV